jgi:hypothetical protein
VLIRLEAHKANRKDLAILTAAVVKKELAPRDLARVRRAYADRLGRLRPLGAAPAANPARNGS